MEVLVRARRLADYIRKANVLDKMGDSAQPHGHLGATLGDAILQAGLNYRTVVSPRVERLKWHWPNSANMMGLQRDLDEFGPHVMLDWRDSEKPNRFLRLVALLAKSGIETESSLAAWLQSPENQSALLQIRGVGPKTVDYLCRLVGGPTVAVDRHLVRFVQLVCPRCVGYKDIRQIVCYAADLLEVERAKLDHAIWQHMTRAADAA